MFGCVSWWGKTPGNRASASPDPYINFTTPFLLGASIFLLINLLLPSTHIALTNECHLLVPLMGASLDIVMNLLFLSS